MAQKSQGFEIVDGEQVEYYIDPHGEKRYLTALPTPDDHKMKALPDWVGAGFEVLDLKQIQPFSRIWDVVPILDQNGKGACLPHAWTTGFMIARAISGAPYVKLSPWYLYSLINNGRDAGSYAGAAVEALLEKGICRDELVPYATVRRTYDTHAADSDAVNYKLREAVQITTFEQAVTAAFWGWAILFDVEAGGGFDTNNEGVCAFLGRRNNHEVMAGEEFKLLKSGEPVIGGRNSWSEKWGVKGRCYWTRRHIEASQTTYALRYTVVDPHDKMPPPAP